MARKLYQETEGHMLTPKIGTIQVFWIDRSDLSSKLVRPVEVAAEQKAESLMPVSVPCDGETPLAFLVLGVGVLTLWSGPNQ